MCQALFKVCFSQILDRNHGGRLILIFSGWFPRQFQVLKDKDHWKKHHCSSETGPHKREKSLPSLMGIKARGGDNIEF